MDLNELRNKIDTVDAEIARLLNERRHPPRRKKNGKRFLKNRILLFPVPFAASVSAVRIRYSVILFLSLL